MDGPQAVRRWGSVLNAEEERVRSELGAGVRSGAVRVRAGHHLHHATRLELLARQVDVARLVGSLGQVDGPGHELLAAHGAGLAGGSMGCIVHAGVLPRWRWRHPWRIAGRAKSM